MLSHDDNTNDIDDNDGYVNDDDDEDGDDDNGDGDCDDDVGDDGTFTSTTITSSLKRELVTESRGGDFFS